MNGIRKLYLAHCERYYKSYPAVRVFFSKKGALTALKIISKLSTGILYTAYIIGAVIFLLVLLMVFPQSIQKSVTVLLFFFAAPFMTFAVTTAVRSGINAMRPYERYDDLGPLIPKSTRGRSCPSRHTACAFAVAFAYIFTFSSGISAAEIIVCAVLLLIAVIVAVSRPLAGVHFPLDVVFGAVIAVICFGVALAVYTISVSIL